MWASSAADEKPVTKRNSTSVVRLGTNSSNRSYLVRQPSAFLEVIRQIYSTTVKKEESESVSLSTTPLIPEHNQWAAVKINDKSCCCSYYYYCCFFLLQFWALKKIRHSVVVLFINCWLHLCLMVRIKFNSGFNDHLKKTVPLMATLWFKWCDCV